MNSTTALILIDIQNGLDELDYYGGARNNPFAESNARKILDFWREKKWPVFHIKHNSTSPDSPLRPNQPGNEIKEIVQPIADEPIIGKNVNSAFIGTDLKERLENQGIQKVVIVGLTTEHCISTSTRMSANLGFETTLISDATAAFDKVSWDGKPIPAEIVHQVELANLNGEFARIIRTEEFLENLS